MSVVRLPRSMSTEQGSPDTQPSLDKVIRVFGEPSRVVTSACSCRA